MIRAEVTIGDHVAIVCVMGAPAVYVLRDEHGLHDRFDRSGAFGAAQVAAAGLQHFKIGMEPFEWPVTTLLWNFEFQEAGVLVDVLTKTVAWHTVWWDVGQARIEYDLLRRAYVGWNVLWAVEGIWSFADVLGVPRAEVRHSQDTWQMDPRLRDEEIGGPGCVLTVRQSGEVHSYPMPYYFDSLDEGIRVGPDAALSVRWDDDFDSSEVGSGFCVDVDQRTVGWWSCAKEEGVFPSAQALWPGWTFVCKGDDFERHNRFAGRRIAEFDPDLKSHDAAILAEPVPFVRPRGLPAFC